MRTVHFQAGLRHFFEKLMTSALGCKVGEFLVLNLVAFLLLTVLLSIRLTFK